MDLPAILGANSVICVCAVVCGGHRSTFEGTLVRVAVKGKGTREKGKPVRVVPAY